MGRIPQSRRALGEYLSLSTVLLAGHMLGLKTELQSLKRKFVNLEAQLRGVVHSPKPLLAGEFSLVW